MMSHAISQQIGFPTTPCRVGMQGICRTQGPRAFYGLCNENVQIAWSRCFALKRQSAVLFRAPKQARQDGGVT